MTTAPEKTVIVPLREDIPTAETWNAESVFADVAAWEAELAAIPQALGAATTYKGRLHEGASVLLDALQASEQMMRRTFKVYFYATMTVACDMTDQAATARQGQAMGLAGRVQSGLAFIRPEMIAIGHETLKGWMAENESLAQYEKYVDDLFRLQDHTLSTDVEEVLGALALPFSGASDTYEMLTSADMRFEDAINADAKLYPVTQSNYDSLMQNADRQVRRTAYESYGDQYLAHKNTLASTLITEVRQFTFENNLRGYASNLEASLAQHNIPSEVFHTLIDTFKANIPTWHRYWAVRRRALGVEKIYPYDIWAPLTKQQTELPFEQAVEWIASGMAPLGEDYVSALRKGCLEDRWVDRSVNQGKRQGAFSFGTFDTMPFIMMSYDDSIGAMSTLAHELGHSMHSHLTRTTQPYPYANYSLFLAEIASNFNQAMTRAYLFEQNDDPYFQIQIIEEAMDNFHRYFLIMPTLARFELEIHQRVEAGKGTTADDMIGLMADLFGECYGDEMSYDRERVGITWAQFQHLYAPFYVYQYATGISAAHYFAKRILSGEDGAVDAYLGFLKTGSSRYPLEVLDAANADMRSPEIVETAFSILDEYVTRLDGLLDQIGVA